MAKEKLLIEANFTDAARYYATSVAITLTCTVVLIPFLIIVVPLVWIGRTIEYKHIRCELYERSLKIHRGWLNKVEKTIPLEKITDLAVNQGPIMRWIGVEAISVETAGQSELAGGAARLVGIQDARGFRDAVLEQRDRMSERSQHAEAGGTPGAPAPALTGDAATITQIRDILLRIESKLDDRG